MSQSPTESSESSSLLRYRQGWNALNRLLHEDRSFSGNEKNCAFLNMHNGQFAGISSVSGLDFNDDSRALALCDWDFDGRLDVWMTGRTAPRVRLVRNQTPAAGHFVAIHLRGNGITTNRDAVGARVEVVTRGNEKSIATLHAGEGFLAQSSQWLHFGLGDQSAIESVKIHWPGAGIENYTSFEADRFYTITQDTGEVATWTPPLGRKPLTAAPQDVLPDTQTARIVPPARLPLPSIKGTEVGSQLQFSRPTLVSVWSTTCTNCLREFAEWSKHASEFTQHGLHVVAVNADSSNEPKEVAQRGELLRRIGFAFENFNATPDSIRNLDFFQRSLMDRWQAMPVPCSFLVDGLGQVVAIYKGPVDRTQVFDDLSLLAASPERVRLAGIPFPGRWAAATPAADPARVTSQMVDHAQVETAIAYLQLFLDTASKSGSQISDLRKSDVLYVHALLLDSQGRGEEALRSLEASRASNPDDFRVRSELAKSYLRRRDLPRAEVELRASLDIKPEDTDLQRELGIVLLSQNKLASAAERFRVAIQQQPDDVLSQFHLGTTLRKQGNWKEAVASYEIAVNARPTFVLAANNLAWILSTHPDELIRQGSKAVKIAERMCQQTNHARPEFLDTLAAAYAEVGEFDKAIATIDRAISLAEAEKASQVDATVLKTRRNRYLDSEPYRESQ